MKKIQKTIKIKSEVYPKEAIQAACYSLIEKAYFFLDSDKKGNIFVSLKPKENFKLSNLEDEFMNELLYSVVRLNINKMNKKIKEYIVYQAIYSLTNPNEEESFEDDPMGIAVPWEEKNEKTKK